MTGTASDVTLAAVVLAGGRASRLGGVDKGALDVGGRTLLAGVLDAVAAAGVPPALTVVVGNGEDLPDGVRRTREDPAFGGPLAALGAGLAHLPDDGGAVRAAEVLVLACDLPHAGALVALLDQPVQDGDDGTVVRDASGRDQWLAGRYRLGALRESVAAVAAVTGSNGPNGLTGLPLRAAVASLRLARVEDARGASLDVDTPGDLAAARATMDIPAPRREDAT